MEVGAGGGDASNELARSWIYAAETDKPGVYLFGDDRSPNRVEPWTVGRFYYFAGSFSNAYENAESAAHWRINSVDGLSFAWRKGMWIKGPIGPDWQAREDGK